MSSTLNLVGRNNEDFLQPYQKQGDAEESRSLRKKPSLTLKIGTRANLSSRNRRSLSFRQIRFDLTIR